MISRLKIMKRCILILSLITLTCILLRFQIKIKDIYEETSQGGHKSESNVNLMSI